MLVVVLPVEGSFVCLDLSKTQTKALNTRMYVCQPANKFRQSDMRRTEGFSPARTRPNQLPMTMKGEEPPH